MTWIIRKVNYASYLRWSMFGTLVVIVVFALSRDAVVGFILVILMGLTMSGVYSITLVYANHTLPGMTRLVTSLITAFAGFGAAVFPALIGYSMDHSGIVSALWMYKSLPQTWMARFWNDRKDYNRDRFLEQYAQMKTKGIRFVVASGNQYYQLRSFFPEIEHEIAFVAENGAY